MPELPEVETSARGIAPHILGQRVAQVVIRQGQLRWPVPKELTWELPQQVIHNITRRGKYLLLHTAKGTVILHFGMSGYVRILNSETTAHKHDHVDIVFENICLRYTDTRRFGAILWTRENPAQHPLLATLGPEPLSDQFHGDYLYQQSRPKKIPIKQFIMDGHVVVGVGNIYATESLFLAGIHPLTPANTIGATPYHHLALQIKQILVAAIKQGGTTLRDFHNSEGKPGYFKQQLNAYGRAGLPCVRCQQPLIALRIQQRATVFCGFCVTI
jgi:formamidopyrimidine-DNA glycosylase